MLMRHKWNRWAMIVPILGLTGYVLAQGARPTPQAGPPGQNVPGQTAMNLDAHFASCLILQNQNEVAVAKLAQQKAQSATVKEFAEKLVREHQQFLQDLERFGGANLKNARATILDGKNQTVEVRRPLAVAVANLPDTFLQIKQEMADECLTTARRELEGKSGHEFEACFIGMQIAGHMHMVDELRVMERHASPQLQSVLIEGRETAQRHLAKAKDLMRDVERVRTASAKDTEKQ